MHKHIILFVALLACPLVVGCGSSSSGGNNFSCDFKIAGAEYCAEYDNLPAADSSAESSACTGESGTAGTSCPSANAVGTCAQAAGGLDYKTTYYKGTGVTAASASAACKTAGGTWTAS